MKIFIDASAFISGFIEKDPNHIQAIKFIESLSKTTNFCTSKLTYFESLTVISKKFGLDAAKSFSQYFKNLPIKTYDISDKDVALAERILFSQRSKNISFFDCLYVSIMKSKGIKKIFTYDKDFKKLAVDIVG